MNRTLGKLVLISLSSIFTFSSTVLCAYGCFHGLEWTFDLAKPVAIAIAVLLNISLFMVTTKSIRYEHQGKSISLDYPFYAALFFFALFLYCFNACCVGAAGALIIPVANESVSYLIGLIFAFVSSLIVFINSTIFHWYGRYLVDDFDEEFDTRRNDYNETRGKHKVVDINKNSVSNKAVTKAN